MPQATSDDPSELLALLSDSLRHQLVTCLVLNDLGLGDLATQLGLSPAVILDNLEPLRAAGIISERGSPAQPMDLAYHLELDVLRALHERVGMALPPEFVPAAPGTAVQQVEAPSARQRVLFLCTHNSARSQIAEALLRLLSKGQVEAFSAGSKPTAVHPLVSESLADFPIDLSAHRSKHLREFLGQDFDYVITVCDTARENYPVFPDARRTLHWNVPDPVAIEGRAAQERAFHQTMNELRTRITYLLIFLERERGEERSVGQA